MAVAFDARFEKGVAGQTSPFTVTSNTATASGTLGGSATLLLAFLSSGQATQAATGLTGITWNGVAMTLIGARDTGQAIYGAFYLYGLISPATGNHDLVATWTGGAATMVLGAISYTGSDLTTAWSDFTFASGTASASETITVTNVGANDAVGVMAGDNNASSMSITAGTQDWNERSLNGNYGGAHRAGSGTVAWTLGSSVDWYMIGARVIASGGADLSVSTIGEPVVGGSVF